jgi:hypothetical protein
VARRSDTFAYAESFDDVAGRYRGLRGGHGVMLTAEDAGLIVKPEVARRQLDDETKPRETQGASPDCGHLADRNHHGRSERGSRSPRLARRFHGTVALDPARVGRDAGRIAEEVIAHLAGQPGAEVSL